MRISLWGSSANDTKTGTMLDVAEEYLVNVCDMTLRTSFVSFPADGESLFNISLAPSILSMCKQVG